MKINSKVVTFIITNSKLRANNASVNTVAGLYRSLYQDSRRYCNTEVSLLNNNNLRYETKSITRVRVSQIALKLSIN